MRVQKKSCSYVKVIMIMQATVMAVFFIYFHWYHHTTITFGEHRSYVNYTTQDLYMNDKLHFNVSLRNEKCVEEFLKKYRKYCNRAIVPTLDIFRSNSEKAAITLCPCIPHSIEIEASSGIQKDLESMKTLDQTPSCYPVLSGGFWKPSGCLPRQRVAIIVPYRDREPHLKIFLQIIHPFLQKQLLQYTVFIVEQVKPLLFNRATLLNVGFKEANARGQFDCFIFHDVDALPEDDRNFYGCYKQPRHVAPYIDKHKYKMRYDRMFGRANAFTKKQFEQANGFSNEFYGWGGEDDDLLNRIEAANMTFLRFPSCIARYTTIEHLRDSGNPIGLKRFLGYQRRSDVYTSNGLSNLVYTIERYEKKQLYTWIAVSLPACPDCLQRKRNIAPWNSLETINNVTRQILKSSSNETSSKQRTSSLGAS